MPLLLFGVGAMIELSFVKDIGSNAFLSVLFSAITLLVGTAIVSIVAYDIYAHPAAPRPVGTAVIKISGTAPFRGEVGTLNRYGTHIIEGRAPVSVEVPYGRADDVAAAMEESSGTIEICLPQPQIQRKDVCKTVEKSSDPDALVMWKAPR